MTSVTVLVTYLDKKKLVKIPLNHKVDSDLQFLTGEFIKLFSVEDSSNVSVTFQQYDSGWDEYIDLDLTDTLLHKDKVKAIVTSKTSSGMHETLPVSRCYDLSPSSDTFSDVSN